MHFSNMYYQPSGIFKSAYVAERELRGGFVSWYLCGWNYVNCCLTLDSWFNWFSHSSHL